MHICFFCKTKDRSDLERVGFYADDIRILRDLGHQVTLATSYREIPNDADLIYAWWWTWAFIPLMKKHLYGIPVIICGVVDYETKSDDQRVCYVNRPWWDRLLQRYAMATADANVFLSRFEFDQITSKFKVHNPKLSPCTVDTQAYRPNPAVKRERFLFNVAWSGGDNLKRKCLKEIVEAFAIASREFPDLTLVMAGKQSEYHQILVDTVTANNITDKVKFLGPISQEKKVQLMQTCLAYVQPTLFEGFGLAIAEAMACGAPMITTPWGAVTEVVGDAGLFSKSEEPQDVARAIIEMVRNENLRATFSRKGPERIQAHFHYRRRLVEIQAMITEVVPDHGQSGRPPRGISKRPETESQARVSSDGL